MSLPPVIRYEWFFWVFEASLVLSNSLLWTYRHLRTYLPEDCHVYIVQDGCIELTGSGWKDGRY
jgi:hypothetical protein